MKSLSEKTDKFGSVWNDVAQLEHAVIVHCSVRWRRAVAISQYALRPALHIVNTPLIFSARQHNML